MQTGDEKHMPLKDRGPQRRFMRDVVDARWNLGEFVLPVAVLLIVVQLVFAQVRSSRSARSSRSTCT